MKWIKVIFQSWCKDFNWYVIKSWVKGLSASQKIQWDSHVQRENSFLKHEFSAAYPVLSADRSRVVQGQSVCPCSVFCPRLSSLRPDRNFSAVQSFHICTVKSAQTCKRSTQKNTQDHRSGRGPVCCSKLASFMLPCCFWTLWGKPHV